MDLYLFDKTKEIIKTVVERELQQIILCVKFRLSKLMSTLREVKNCFNLIHESFQILVSHLQSLHYGCSK